MIKVTCDICREEVAEDVNAGCDLRLGTQNYKFQSCVKCREDVVAMLETVLRPGGLTKLGDRTKRV